MRPTTVVKRDGQLVPFDVVRIAHAITRAQHAVGIEVLAALGERFARDQMKRQPPADGEGVEHDATILLAALAHELPAVLGHQSHAR